MSEVVIKMEHVRAAYGCGPGVVLFFRRHNLNLRKFLRDGISSTELEKLNDAMVDKVIEVARGRQ